MAQLQQVQTLQRLKEVMGESVDDTTILNAMMIHHGDFERTLNYLLEGNFENLPQQSHQQQQLRQSITDAFTTTPIRSDSQWLPTTNDDWNQLPADKPTQTNYDMLDSTNEAREPLVLPNSPPKGSYQPLTVTGQTTPTEEFRSSNQAFQLSSSTKSNPNNLKPLSTSTTLTALPTPSQSSALINNTNSTEIQLIDDSPEKRYEAELNAAIEASLATDSALNKPSQNVPTAEQASLKELSAEDEQMSKALEESLAMSGSRTLEADGKFSHPPPSKRQRAAGTPTALRVHNPHLVFLPCLLSAMYAARPFRERILAFQPSSQLVSQELIDHDLEGLWNGKSSWRSGETWSEKPQASEIVMAVQRLFTAMTYTKRSYLDVQELSLLLGYEEGEMISWSLNEPNKGCHRTYETIAEAWRELSCTLFKANHPEPELDEKVLEEYEPELRLFHWKGHKLPLPLPEGEGEGEEKKRSLTDNSTTSLTLNASGDGSTLNEIYACIDAQVWLPEMSQAHFLDGSSQVIAFEIDRKFPSGPSSSANSFGELRSPFKLHNLFWVDRYLLQKRHKIAELREEISRIEGEADVSLARRNQLSMAGDKDLLSTLKATIDYLSVDTQFPMPTLRERESKKKEMLPKFQKSLARLEAELSSLDERAKTALAEAKAVFDVDEMRQVGPHELCAVVVSDGFSGREHMWTYVKSEDGKWFKSLDQTVTEVSLDTVLSDPAGLHMNSGHIFAIYALKPTPDQESTDSLKSKLPTQLEQAIEKDNELFAAEVLEAGILEPSAYISATEDVEMTSDSPRSDVADAGGPVDLDLVPDCASPLFGPPLRLSGGARLDFADDDGDGGDDDDDEDDDDNGVEEDLVELGFLKKISKALNVRTMTGKVGGRPIWLDPEAPLDPSSTTCSSCGQSMKFFMQLNAPDDTVPEAYFRTLYVFICPRFSCLRGSLGSGTASASVAKVFRTQLPQSSPAASAPAVPRSNQPRDPGSFREWEIVCDEEPADSLALKIGNLRLDNLPKFELDSKKKDQDAKVKETKALVDDAFLRFQARISRAPEQILRYLRVKTPEVEPLWANEMGKGALEASLGKQQKCERCGAGRTAEFQIIPTLLSSLGPAPPRKKDAGREEERRGALEEDVDGLDFGTVVVFTCPKACTSMPPSSPPPPPSTPLPTTNHDGDSLPKAPTAHSWIQEAALVQLFSNEGVFSRAHPSS
ncbi:hypothetical protein PCASD_22507 [Puccinia coronata f. sp. avenae]|uniref:Programmed cell death protein 2 C-terminal domain-containing protein n=1 Tax=Puccinia coronata f. sp. avenae TaxID=200324 RepID=A0A2N5RZB5_9BASI|nr:hypothetical protein PCASD_22507 [Puccinia coronata f. sp. avenae]